MEKGEKQLSQEEISKLRKTTEAFYTDQIPLLKLQCEYEELSARIEKARFEQLDNKVKYMQLHLSLKQKPEEDGKSESSK